MDKDASEEAYIGTTTKKPQNKQICNRNKQRVKLLGMKQ